MKGHIRQLADDKFRIFVHLGDSKYTSQLFRGSKRAAQRKAAQLVDQHDKGTLVAPSNLTVAALLQRWLDDHAARTVSPRTLEGYSEIVRCHLVPALGDRRLDKLTALDIDAYYSTAQASGRRDQRKTTKGLSARTVLHHHRVLSAALKQAKKWKLITSNPCQDATPPKPVNAEMRALAASDLLRLLERLKTHAPNLYAPALVAATTGLRRGELLALRWSDLNLETGKLTVARSLEETKTSLTFKPPKTRAGSRTIGVLSMTLDALRRHKVDQAKTRLAAGPLWQDHDLVFPHLDGTPWRPSNLTVAFIEAIRALPPELRHLRLRFHDLRHSHATQLLAAGVHPKIASERLGHSKVGITLDTYSHVLEGMDAAAVQTLDNALRSESATVRRQ